MGNKNSGRRTWFGEHKKELIKKRQVVMHKLRMCRNCGTKDGLRRERWGGWFRWKCVLCWKHTPWMASADRARKYWNNHFYAPDDERWNLYDVPISEKFHPNEYREVMRTGKRVRNRRKK